MKTLTTGEAGTIFHIPAGTFAQWCREGTLPATKIGGEWQMARIHPLQGGWWRGILRRGQV